MVVDGSGRIDILGAVRRWLLVCALVSVLPAPVAAQAEEDTSEEAEPDAREAFARGSEAASEERWADSERWFRRAYELSGVSSALFNQAVALRALGRHREARDAFRRLLGEDIDPSVRETARELMEQSAARVASLRLQGLDPDTEHGVQLDGEPREDDRRRPLVLETDEGTHSVLVVRSGYEPFTWTGRVEPGGMVSVPVELQALPEHRVVVRETVRENTSVFEEPAFWIIIGVVLAATAAAITTGVVFDQAQLQPMSGVRIEL